MAIAKGLSAFPITPADDAGRVDVDALAHLLTRLRNAGVDSVGLLGSTGTYAYLSRTERQRAIEAASACIGGDVQLVVGVGALRTDEVVALTRHAQQSGADAVLLAPMSYTPLTDEEVYRHYRAAAGATDLPVCIYNNPATTHFSFSLVLLERLSRIANITAVKMPLPADGNLANDVRRMRDALPDGFVIGYSGDWGCADALLAGADTWFSVIGGILPEPALALTRAAQAGDADLARTINARFGPLWTLFQTFGSLRVVYAIAGMLGATDLAPPRPVLPLGPDDRRRVEAALEQIEA